MWKWYEMYRDVGLGEIGHLLSSMQRSVKARFIVSPCLRAATRPPYVR